jgi:hypothetical protein
MQILRFSTISLRGMRLRMIGRLFAPPASARRLSRLHGSRAVSGRDVEQRGTSVDLFE